MEITDLFKIKNEFDRVSALYNIFEEKTRLVKLSFLLL